MAGTNTGCFFSFFNAHSLRPPLPEYNVDMGRVNVREKGKGERRKRAKR